jgi:hypothetical protein
MRRAGLGLVRRRGVGAEVGNQALGRHAALPPVSVAHGGLSIIQKVRGHVLVRISASGRHWPGSRAAWRSPRLLRRFPELAAAGDPVRREAFLLRGYDTLPVIVA